MGVISQHKSCRCGSGGKVGQTLSVGLVDFWLLLPKCALVEVLCVIMTDVNLHFRLIWIWVEQLLVLIQGSRTLHPDLRAHKNIHHVWFDMVCFIKRDLVSSIPLTVQKWSQNIADTGLSTRLLSLLSSWCDPPLFMFRICTEKTSFLCRAKAFTYWTHFFHTNNPYQKRRGNISYSLYLPTVNACDVWCRIFTQYFVFNGW